MIDVVIVLILAVLVGSALAYIIKCKKKGICIGCPDAKTCASHHADGSGEGCGGSCGSCPGCRCHTNVK